MPTYPKILPAESLAAWSRYAVMSRDCTHEGLGRGDGILTQDELRSHIEKLTRDRYEAVARREGAGALTESLSDSRQMLRDMEVAGVEGLNYLPDEIKELELPGHLVRRAVELLMRDDVHAIGEIDQDVIDRARARYFDMRGMGINIEQSRNQALHEISQLAEKLGLE